jgi:hypothetical protein
LTSNTYSQSGETAFLKAVKDGQYLEEADVLFEADADVNVCNKESDFSILLAFICLHSHLIAFRFEK